MPSSTSIYPRLILLVIFRGRPGWTGPGSCSLICAHAPSTIGRSDLGLVSQIFYELPLPPNRHTMVTLTAGLACACGAGMRVPFSAAKGQGVQRILRNATEVAGERRQHLCSLQLPEPGDPSFVCWEPPNSQQSLTRSRRNWSPRPRVAPHRTKTPLQNRQGSLSVPVPEA